MNTFELAETFGIEFLSDDQKRIIEEIISNYFREVNLQDALYILDYIKKELENNATTS